MKAAVITEPKSIVAKEYPKPVLAPGEALVRVRYGGICGSDMHLYHGAYSRAKFPIIPGHEFAGELVELSDAAPEGIRIGDSVGVEPSIGCGMCYPCLEGRENVCKTLSILGIYADGGFAEYVKCPARNLVRLRDGIDFKLAALLEPLTVAYHDVRQSGLRVGQKVLVIGSGPIGMLIAMLSRRAGAGLVVLTEVNKFRLDFAEANGFRTLNGRDPDMYQKALDMTGGNGFDVVFECSGTGVGVNNAIVMAKITGTIVQVGMGFGAPEINIFDITYKELDIRGVRIHPMKDFKYATELLNSGVMDDDLRVLTTKIFPLDAVAEAFRYSEEDGEHFKVLLEI